MFLKAFIILATLLVVFLIVVATRPAAFSITRTTTIARPVTSVYPHVNDLRKWQAWSPWAKKDPDARTTYSGPIEGPGSSMQWEGNREVGEGTMTIVNSTPSQQVELRLDFKKPFEATHDAVLSFSEADGQTTVRWTMTGNNGFMGKAVSLFIDCDSMVGGDFEKGLASLKSIVESGSSMAENQQP